MWLYKKNTSKKSCSSSDFCIRYAFGLHSDCIGTFTGPPKLSCKLRNAEILKNTIIKINNFDKSSQKRQERIKKGYRRAIEGLTKPLNFHKY